MAICLVTKYATGREKQTVLENESLCTGPRRSEFNRDCRCSLSIRLDTESHIKASRSCYEVMATEGQGKTSGGPGPLQASPLHMEDPRKQEKIPTSQARPEGRAWSDVTGKGTWLSYIGEAFSRRLGTLG